MRRLFVGLCAVLSLGFAPKPARAQSAPFPKPKWFEEVTGRPDYPSQLPKPEHLRDYVADGKLRLTLDQVIQLTLANNTSVKIDDLTYQNAWYPILRAFSPFDPLFQTTSSVQRSTTPTTVQTQGAQTLSTLFQSGQFNYTQTFQTGTNVGVGFGMSRTSDNDSFDLFNPNLQSSLNFVVTQPLLRGAGLFANRAPILIARSNLRQSRANFEVQISSILQQAVDQYWNVVNARENLLVLRKSVDQAQASYDHDKRSLELGAISSYDIFQSESELATRKVAVIQAEYSLKQNEDLLRQYIGADLDPAAAAMDMDLTEAFEPAGELFTLDAGHAIELALAKRPELHAEKEQLTVDDMSIRLAHNEMLPSLGLSGSYASNGLGGDQLNPDVTPPVIIAPGGLADALGQVDRFKFPTYGATLSLNLPIRNRAAEADLGTSQVSKRRDLYTERLLQEEVELDARNSIHQLEQAKLSIGAAKIARDLSQKNLDAQQRKYDLGAVTIFFVLDAQTQLATAEQNLVNAEISYQQAVAAVDHATGELLDRYHVQIHDPKP
jgi:outer membrane protein TolC